MVSSSEPAMLPDRGRSLRSGRTLPIDDGADPLDIIDSVAIESSAGEEEEEEERYRESELERAWDESSVESSDISDWTEEAGIDISSILRKRTKKRKQLGYTRERR